MGVPGQAVSGAGQNGLFGQPVHVEWHVQYNPPGSNAKVRYIGIVNNREFYFDDTTDTKGKPIVPGIFNSGKSNGTDGTRFRVDGSPDSQTGMPQAFLEM